MEQKYKIFIILGTLVFLSLIFLYGMPAEIKFVGTPPFIEITWKAPEDEQPEPTPPKPSVVYEPIVLDITIEKLEPRQQIYEPGDRAYVDFTIKNTLNVEYNLTVDWLHNNTRHHGWSNVSTDHYNTTESTNPWQSWYDPLPFKGDWEVHLVIEYQRNNKTYSKDDATTFRVV